MNSLVRIIINFIIAACIISATFYPIFLLLSRIIQPHFAVSIDYWNLLGYAVLFSIVIMGYRMLYGTKEQFYSKYKLYGFGDGDSNILPCYYKSSGYSEYWPLFEQVRYRFGVKNCEMYIQHSNNVNAWATHIDRKPAVIITSRFIDLIRTYSSDEKLQKEMLQFVIAHELSHLCHGDLLPDRILLAGVEVYDIVSSVIRGVLNGIYSQAANIPFLGILLYPIAFVIELFFVIISSFLQYLLIPFCTGLLFQWMEYRCDNDAVRYSGRVPAIAVQRILAEGCEITTSGITSTHPATIPRIIRVLKNKNDIVERWKFKKPNRSGLYFGILIFAVIWASLAVFGVYNSGIVKNTQIEYAYAIINPYILSVINLLKVYVIPQVSLVVSGAASGIRVLMTGLTIIGDWTLPFLESRTLIPGGILKVIALVVQSIAAISMLFILYRLVRLVIFILFWVPAKMLLRFRINTNENPEMDFLLHYALQARSRWGAYVALWNGANPLTESPSGKKMLYEALDTGVKEIAFLFKGWKEKESTE